MCRDAAAAMNVHKGKKDRKKGRQRSARQNCIIILQNHWWKSFLSWDLCANVCIRNCVCGHSLKLICINSLKTVNGGFFFLFACTNVSVQGSTSRQAQRWREWHLPGSDTDICMNEKLKLRAQFHQLPLIWCKRPSASFPAITNKSAEVPQLHNFIEQYLHFLGKSRFLPSLTLSDFCKLCLSALHSHIFWFLGIILWGERDPI